MTMRWGYNEIRQVWSRLVDLVPQHGYRNSSQIIGRITRFIRSCIFSILSAGPLPNHIAFILDGNRRYAKKHNLKEGDGHRAGFLALMSLLKYCYELNIKYATIYAFSIDNFRRRPEEVKLVMELMQEKIEGFLKEERVVKEYGVRVHFVGNLKLLSESIQSSMERVIKASEGNTKAVLVICAPYTSTDEIVHSIQESFDERAGDSETEEKFHEPKLVDIERHMYMDVAPDVDILIRSSGETRLSNFLLWQTVSGLLYSPPALWPELGLRHIVWAVLNFQRHHSYLQKNRKQA